jgi:hypothetical protein
MPLMPLDKSGRDVHTMAATQIDQRSHNRSVSVLSKPMQIRVLDIARTRQLGKDQQLRPNGMGLAYLCRNSFQVFCRVQTLWGKLNNRNRQGWSAHAFTSESLAFVTPASAPCAELLFAAPRDVHSDFIGHSKSVGYCRAKHLENGKHLELHCFRADSNCQDPPEIRESTMPINLDDRIMHNGCSGGRLTIPQPVSTVLSASTRDRSANASQTRSMLLVRQNGSQPLGRQFFPQIDPAPASRKLRAIFNDNRGVERIDPHEQRK